MRTWVSYCGARSRCFETADLRAVVSNLLCKSNIEDGKAAIWIDADENGGTDLRKDFALFLKSCPNI